MIGDPAHVEVGGHGLARRQETLGPLTKQRADIIAAAQVSTSRLAARA
jgi:hypothetical protein